jgi:hypothetical protein
MFDKVLYDLKECEYDLQEIVNDKDTDVWVSHMLRCVIYRIQDTQKNIREIADDYETIPDKTYPEQKSAKFKTAGELLDFLLGLRDRDLNKRVVIGRNVWDERMFTKWCSVQHKAEWIRNDVEDIMIFCK